jgi:hypothetical protein
VSAGRNHGATAPATGPLGPPEPVQPVLGGADTPGPSEGFSGRCPVCATPVWPDGNGGVRAHAWLDPVTTIGYRAQSRVFQFRGACPGEGLGLV